VIQIDITVMTHRCVVSASLVSPCRFMWFTCFDASTRRYLHAILLSHLHVILLRRLRAIVSCVTFVRLTMQRRLRVVYFAVSHSCDLGCCVTFVRLSLLRGLHTIWFVASPSRDFVCCVTFVRFTLRRHVYAI
jgi:hypothetical protein